MTMSSVLVSAYSELLERPTLAFVLKFVKLSSCEHLEGDDD